MVWGMQRRQMGHWMQRSLKGRKRLDQRPLNFPFRTPPGRRGCWERRQKFREEGRRENDIMYVVRLEMLVRGYPDESSVSSRSYLR